jgi:hypothetical protein
MMSTTSLGTLGFELELEDTMLVRLLSESINRPSFLDS